MKKLFSIILLFTFLYSNGQWTTDTNVNTLVVDSEGGDMKAIGASDGKTYVVFWKVVAAPVNYELRLQILDVDGTQLLGPDGMLVSDSLPMSTFTVIWNIEIDSDDNLYIGVTGTGGGELAYAFKLDGNGNHLWPTNGVNVGSGYAVTILPLTSGEAIVSWFSSSGQGLMQKYDASGNSVWGSTQPIENAGNDTVPANLFEMSNGDYVVVFHSITFGINSNLFAQRYDDSGVLQWSSPTQLSNLGTVFNTSYSGLQDGDVVYMGYKASPGFRFDSYLQRLNPDGSLPWGINGTDFDTDQSEYEMDTKIAYTSGSDFIWSICTYTDSSQSQKGQYVQKFDKNSGARLLTENAKEVYPIGSENVHAGDLQLKNDSPLFLLKSGFDNGATPTTLGVVYLDENGDFYWPEESRPVATFAANKSRIQYTKPVNNQSVAVFIEEKSVEPKIYAQNFIDEVLSNGDYLDQSNISYTNPIKSALHINSNIGIMTVKVRTMLGRLLYEMNSNGEKSVMVSADSWKSGIYLISVGTTNGDTGSFKIIKE